MEARAPDWFTIAEPLLLPTFGRLRDAVEHRKNGTPHVDIIPEAAGLHLAHTFEASVDLNRRGRHALAISLIRQCVEALTIVDAGLQDESLRSELLIKWQEDQIQAGRVRMTLEPAWNGYGPGLHEEKWADFMREFAQAVQPYAHYSTLLQAWQFAVPEGERLIKAPDGMYRARLQLGPDTYDPDKARRVTLLHCLLGWAINRIVKAREPRIALEPSVLDGWTAALKEAPDLGRGTLEWHQNFWAHQFDMPLHKGG